MGAGRASSRPSEETLRMRRSLILAGISLLALLSIACPSWSADVDPVNRAIDRGVAALKKALKGVPREDPQSNPKSRGYARMSEMQTGVAALAVLTALECGVPVDDPAIQKRLAGIREASLTVTHTYTLAVTILVLDKIRDPDDVPLIHSMALRL